MGRAKRADDGGMVFHVLNRANARATIFEKPEDYAASGAPQIVSTPPVQGVVGDLYLYQPTVVDSLTNNFTFTLLQSPLGMTIVAATGEIRRTPTAGQTGSADVTRQVDDHLGGLTVQRFAITVSAVTPNQPPSIDSTPPRLGTVGTPLDDLPQAFDSEGQSLHFVLD